MKLDLQQFRHWKQKKLTLLGMSGVGKTRLSSQLREHGWFHYSGDYRIGTRYLDEAILDMVKQSAMQQPLLRQLLRKDWIHIGNNIKIDDLGPVLAYVGKPGRPDLGGVELEQFRHRQQAYRQAEVLAMYDVPAFITRATEIYGYDHFVNDAGGSLCELDQEVIDFLDQHTMLIYISTTSDEEEQALVRRAQCDPKPLYYRPEFLDQHLAQYLAETGLDYAAEIDPDEFTRWVFPKLFHSRIPRYQEIARLGYSVTSQQVSDVRDQQDFVQLLDQVIARTEQQQPENKR